MRKSCFYITLFFIYTILTTLCSGETDVKRKLLVIGIDGMDPTLLQGYINDGKMPNFKRIIDNGGDFKPLGTSYPPQSPVAWSNFAIGANPGKHGIFDFIHRHLGTVVPYLAGVKTIPPTKFVHVGRWQIPLNRSEVKNLRGGKAFWEYLCQHGVSSCINTLPGNYPPECPCHSGQWRALSGMGTPDILGTQGTFSYYTTKKLTNLKPTIGGGRVYFVTVTDNTVTARLYGPAHPYKNPAKYKNSIDATLSVPFTVYIDEKNDVAKILVCNQEIILKKGEFSDFFRIQFPIIPYLQSMSAICRFYLKECHPDFKLYVSPLNIDPSDPAVPISAPATYAKELFNALGYFYTQSMPPDSKALQHEIFTDDEFLMQMHLVFEEEKKRLFYELDRFSEGMIFHYFNVLDQTCHTFWRTIDKKHPLYTEELGKKYGLVIENLYGEFDAVIGKILEKIDSDTALIIVSDHGFTSFRRGVNLNTILLNNGYIALKTSAPRNDAEFFENVDWNRTRAFNLGINAVYINLFGREPIGTVLEDEYDEVCEKLRNVLLGVVDPETGIHPIKHVALRREIYSGPYVKQAPDLIIGYEEGYRASWDTILGKIPEKEIVDNLSPWSGDHCVYFNIVPGVVISNRKISAQHPSLVDIAPAILQYYDLKKGEDMEGKSIFTHHSR